jgi:hypothetical protein
LLFHFGPCWKKWGQVPNPFEIILVLFILKGAMLVPNGFGTWPLLFHFGPCWEKWGQVPNPFKIILVFSISKGVKLVPKGFGTRPLLFHFGPCWKKWGQVPNPFKIILALFILNVCTTIWVPIAASKAVVDKLGPRLPKL